MSSQQQPREAKTFGVGSCLQDDARVYYSHLSSMDHIGRVSDLFSALLKNHSPNPLKIRMLSLLIGFQAYFVRSAIQNGNQTVLMECGNDLNTVALGVSFIYPGFGKEALAGLPDRIRTNTPGSAFEKILFNCADISDRCYFRIQPQTQKIEIVGVFAFSSKDLEMNVPISQKLSFILIGENAPKKPEVKEYKELGDTNYAKLLEQKIPNDQILAPTNGEFIAKSVKVDDFKKIIEDSQKKDDFKQTITDDTNKDENDKTFSGEAYKKNNEKFVFKATAADEEIYKSLPEAKETDQELEESAAGLDDVVTSVRGQTLDGLSRSSNSNKDETKKAVDSLFKDLVQEKSKLVDTARRVSMLLKKKALEFRNKERTWQEEARRKDEEIKQKQSAYTHIKEMLSKANAQTEQLQRQALATNNDVIFKEKYDIVRAELAELKREHMLATRKVAETTRQLTEAQTAVKENSTSESQTKLVSELNQKVAQSNRQLEEYKRVNAQIMGKVTELEKKRGSGNSQLEEFKSKLAKTTQLFQEKSKESERNRVKIKELQDEKDKLFKELVEVRTAFNAIKKPTPPKAA
ncbi:MAG: hypothetical protein KA715_12805 [Xanthomonadaceae bacterium]|nr:hypothetical protein [Xanthomonadaceae bacterium]